MVNQLIGAYVLTASTPVSLPLRPLFPRHSLNSLQLKVLTTLTPSVNNWGPATNGDLDAAIGILLTRLRMYGGAPGEPINISQTNLRSVFLGRTGVDWTAKVVATNTNLVGGTFTSGQAYVCAIDVTIPFFDSASQSDPNWAAPCTDTFRHEGNLEITCGTLAATAGFTGTSTLTPSVNSITMYAHMDDSHGSYVAPVTAMRDLGQSNNTQAIEPGLYRQLFDTRPAYGAGTYVPTYVVFKDGKIVLSNLNAIDLALIYNKAVSYPGAFDFPGRVGPILFLGRGYSEEDFKPSLANHTVNIPVGFVAGTYVYDLWRMVTRDMEQRQAQNEGMAAYDAPLKACLHTKAGDNVHGKVGLFMPRWLKPKAA